VPTLSVGALLDATGGTLLAGDPRTPVTSYAIDSRKISRGGAFFALAGERTDGHAFVGDAGRHEAAVAIVARRPEGNGPLPAALIQVDDVAAALARSGAYARQKLRARFIALTGSAGKTTTKEFIAKALGASLKVHRNIGNLNNELGVPLTLLSCPDDAEAAVIEMGMRGPGEIAFLARLVDSDIALVTNVRPVHLEFFESVDGIAAAKGELFAVLRENATAVVNLDDARVRVQAARHAGPRVTFGQTAGADVVLLSVSDRFLPGAALTLRIGGRTRTLSLRVGGAHAALDALAAAATVVACGVPIEPALDALTFMEPAPGRGRISELPGPMTLVDDTYNSNPEALASVLRTLGASSPAGRRVLVMGDMLELGANAAAFHREAGEQIAASGIGLLVTVGPLSRQAAEVARRAGIEVAAFDDASGAAGTIASLVRPGDLVVVKGSRGIRLEQVVDALVTRRGEAA